MPGHHNPSLRAESAHGTKPAGASLQQDDQGGVERARAMKSSGGYERKDRPSSPRGCDRSVWTIVVLRHTSSIRVEKCASPSSARHTRKRMSCSTASSRRYAPPHPPASRRSLLRGSAAGRGRTLRAAAAFAGIGRLTPENTPWASPLSPHRFSPLSTPRRLDDPEQASHHDKDERFMATNDLIAELKKNPHMMQCSSAVSARPCCTARRHNADVESVAIKYISQRADCASGHLARERSVTCSVVRRGSEHLLIDSVRCQ